MLQCRMSIFRFSSVRIGKSAGRSRAVGVLRTVGVEWGPSMFPNGNVSLINERNLWLELHLHSSSRHFLSLNGVCKLGIAREGSRTMASAMTTAPQTVPVSANRPWAPNRTQQQRRRPAPILLPIAAYRDRIRGDYIPIAPRPSPTLFSVTGRTDSSATGNVAIPMSSVAPTASGISTDSMGDTTTAVFRISVPNTSVSRRVPRRTYQMMIVGKVDDRRSHHDEGAAAPTSPSDDTSTAPATSLHLIIGGRGVVGAESRQRAVPNSMPVQLPVGRRRRRETSYFSVVGSSVQIPW